MNGNLREEQEKYFDDRDKQSDWLQNASLDELNSKTDWNTLIELETGFSDLFYNSNTIFIEENKLLSILYIMESRNQRYFEDIYFIILLFPLSIREWFVKFRSRKPDLFIEDMENY